LQETIAPSFEVLGDQISFDMMTDEARIRSDWVSFCGDRQRCEVVRYRTSALVQHHQLAGQPD
jgi:hypothetical protein